MSLTLYINRSESHCECSYHSIDFRLKNCPICGGKWTHLSSDYAGLQDSAIPLRPDLIPHFEWEGFWESKQGETAKAELAALNIDAMPDGET